jgi:hypothetical protein
VAERQALDRLSWVHGVGALGDGMVAVALAGTLFFSVPLAAARPRVGLYLLVTMAPFAVVAPLLGRLLDGRRGASRLAMVGAFAGRALLATWAASRLSSWELYPLTLGLLVCSRAHGISRSAIVPELASPDRPLVAVNGRMARVAAVGATVGALLAVGVHKLFGSPGVLHVAGVAFLGGVALALLLPGTRRRRGSAAGTGVYDHVAEGALARGPVGLSARVRLARSASALNRAAAGFALFLLAFALRQRGVQTAGLGLLLAAVGVGGTAGAFVVPRLGKLLREEGLLLFGLGLSAACALLLAGHVGTPTAALAGLLIGGAVAAARLGFESLVQREVPQAVRGTAITRAETVFQLAWVLGALPPVALPLPTDPALLAVGALCALAALAYAAGLFRLRGFRDERAAPTVTPGQVP